MNVDFSASILDLKGNVIAPENEPMTVSSVCVGALLATLKGDEGLGGNKKAEMFKLALKISDKAECDVSPEEIVLLRERVGRLWGPLVVGRVYEFLS